MAIKYGVDHGWDSQAFGVDLDAISSADDLSFFDKGMESLRNKSTESYNRTTSYLKKLASSSGKYTYDDSKGILTYRAGRQPTGILAGIANNTRNRFGGRMVTEYDPAPHNALFPQAGFMNRGGMFQPPKKPEPKPYGDWRDAFNTGMIQGAAPGMVYKSRGGKGGWGHGWESLVKGYGDKWDTMSADEKWKAITGITQEYSGYYNKKRGFMNKLKNFGTGVLNAASKVLSNPISGAALGLMTAGIGTAAAGGLQAAGQAASKVAGTELLKQAGSFATKAAGKSLLSSVAGSLANKAGTSVLDAAGKQLSSTQMQAPSDIMGSIKDGISKIMSSDITDKAQSVVDLYQKYNSYSEAEGVKDEFQKALEQLGVNKPLQIAEQAKLTDLMKGNVSGAADNALDNISDSLKRQLIAKGHNPLTSGYGRIAWGRGMGDAEYQMLSQERDASLKTLLSGADTQLVAGETAGLTSQFASAAKQDLIGQSASTLLDILT